MVSLGLRLVWVSVVHHVLEIWHVNAEKNTRDRT